MKAVVLAAGNGTRMGNGEIKPLMRVLAVPMLERVIRTASEGGVTQFLVVTGHRAEPVQKYVRDLSKRSGINISTVHNSDWAKGNGTSVAAARSWVGEQRFLLTMCDHLHTSETVAGLLKRRMSEGVSLAVIEQPGDNGNYRNHEPDMTADGDTVALVRNETIVSFGKGLPEYSGVDTGLFFCAPAVFTAMDQAIAEGRFGNNDGMARLAALGKLEAHVIQGQFWHDVDTPREVRIAEADLLRNFGGKDADGSVSRHLNRPISRAISRRLVHTNITPNTISFIGFLLSLIAALFMGAGSYWALAAGGLLCQFASIIDGCDGEIARLKFLRTEYGGWFDAVLDRYADASMILGLSWHVWPSYNERGLLVLTVLAIVGSLMNSYTGDKATPAIKKAWKGRWRIRMGRDVRSLIICLSAIFNLPLVALVLLALGANTENFRRLIVARPRS